MALLGGFVTSITLFTLLNSTFTVEQYRGRVVVVWQTGCSDYCQLRQSLSSLRCFHLAVK